MLSPTSHTSSRKTRITLKFWNFLLISIYLLTQGSFNSMIEFLNILRPYFMYEKREPECPSRKHIESLKRTGDNKRKVKEQRSNTFCTSLLTSLTPCASSTSPGYGTWRPFRGDSRYFKSKLTILSNQNVYDDVSTTSILYCNLTNFIPRSQWSVRHNTRRTAQEPNKGKAAYTKKWRKPQKLLDVQGGPLSVAVPHLTRLRILLLTQIQGRDDEWSTNWTLLNELVGPVVVEKMDIIFNNTSRSHDNMSSI